MTAAPAPPLSRDAPRREERPATVDHGQDPPQVAAHSHALHQPQRRRGRRVPRPAQTNGITKRPCREKHSTLRKLRKQSDRLSVTFRLFPTGHDCRDDLTRLAIVSSRPGWINQARCTTTSAPRKIETSSDSATSADTNRAPGRRRAGRSPGHRDDLVHAAVTGQRLDYRRSHVSGSAGHHDPHRSELSSPRSR